MSLSLTYDDAGTEMVGRCFVLGMPNAKGESIITLGGTCWLIANPQHIPAGERVKVVRQEEEWIAVVAPVV